MRDSEVSCFSEMCEQCGDCAHCCTNPTSCPNFDWAIQGVDPDQIQGMWDENGPWEWTEFSDKGYTLEESDTLAILLNSIPALIANYREDQDDMSPSEMQELAVDVQDAMDWRIWYGKGLSEGGCRELESHLTRVKWALVQQISSEGAE